MTLTALLTVSISSFGGVVPAQAALQIAGTGPLYVSAEYGDTFDYTYPCTADGEAITYSLSGNVPAGLTVDSNTGRVTGTIEYTGYFAFQVDCHTSNSGTGSSVYLNVATRAHAFFHVTPLNDQNCSVRMTADLLPNHEGSWLQATVNGNVLYFASPVVVPKHGSESYTISYDNIMATTLDDGTTPVQIFKNNAQDPFMWDPITAEDAAQIQCGSSVSWEYWTDYTNVGYVAQTVTATRNTVSVNPVTPYLRVTAMHDQNCSYLIEGFLPANPDANSVSLEMMRAGETDPNEVTIGNVSAGQPFKVALATDGTFEQIFGVTTEEVSAIQASFDPVCGDSTSFKLRYAANGIQSNWATESNVVATEGNDLAPVTNGLPPVISTEYLGGAECTVKITGYSPKPSLSVSEPVVSIFYAGSSRDVKPNTVSADGRFEINYGLNGNQNPDFTVLHTENAGGECGDTLFMSAFYMPLGADSIEGPQTIIATGVGQCGPGTYRAIPNMPCVEASPGYYVETVDAVAQLACPAGKYSAEYGSANCVPSPAGSYVPYGAMSFAIACPAGTYAELTGLTECVETPLDAYSGNGASTPTYCPPGFHTFADGSKSPNDCLPNLVQKYTFTKWPVGLKFKKTLLLPKVSTANLRVDVFVTGKCTVVDLPSQYKIVAGNSKGTCTVTVANRGEHGINEFTMTKVLKISKTGK
jgi:hypothetical protein